MLAIIIKIIIIVLPAGIHTSGKGENLLECKKLDSSEISGEIIGTISFVGKENTEHVILKKNDNHYILICKNGNMSFDKTIEQLKLFSNVPLFFPDYLIIKMTLNDGKSYIYDEKNGNTSVYTINFLKALKNV